MSTEKQETIRAIKAELYRRRVERMPGGERFLRGVGQGVKRSVAGLGNLVGAVDDETLQDMDAEEAPLANTTSGGLGRVGGNVATFMLPGALYGKAAAGLGGLGRTALAAAEGAASAASMAEVGEQGSAAATGALLGGGINLAAQGGGRLLRGAVEKSDEYKALLGDVAKANAVPGAAQRELFVPISQGARNAGFSGAAKKGYQSLLPMSVGVEPRLNAQSRKAADTMREVILQKAAPEGVTVPAGAADDVSEMMTRLKGEHDLLYSELRNFDMKTPNLRRFGKTLAQKLKADNPEALPADVDEYVRGVIGQMAKMSDGKPLISGWNMKVVRDKVARFDKQVEPHLKGGSFTAGRAVKGFSESTREAIDDLFKARGQEAMQAGDTATAQIIDDYFKNAEAYSGLRALKRPVNNAAGKKGSFDFGAVARSARDKQSDIATLDQDANAVLGRANPAAKLDQVGRIMAYSLQGGGVLAGAGPAVAATAGVANLMALKSFQKALYGDTKLQMRLAKILDKNPQLGDQLERAMRLASTAAAGD